MPAIWTILFTDLESSTRLWQDHPEAMQSALARHDELIRTAVEASQGQVVKTTGDGFHAVFGSALDGLGACICAQHRLLQEPWGETGPLRVRMGLHAGEVQQRGGDYYGTTVNRAARLMSAASGGQVLLSAAVASLVADSLPQDVSLLDLGEHRLKDLQRPEHIFQLVHSELPSDFPAIASLNRLPNNLPSQPTVFVGRRKELEEINKLMVADRVRLVTLIGPGGTGKTRLALQAGAELSDRFAGGTYFVDLAPIRDPASVLTAIARVTGINESGNGSLFSDLTAQLKDRALLLLLDNFEQVTPAAVQMAALLQECPLLKLLITSREALHVRGEHLYRVPPLGLPSVDVARASPQVLAQYEAVQLFVDRAQAVRPDFTLTADNAGAIAEICLRLDGLPLAIELAAARIRLFSPQALQQRLSSRLDLLKGGARDLPERQQTLRDTIEWSYDLLEPPEQMLFAVLSVFSSCTFDAVEAVAAQIDVLGEAGIDAIDGLISLTDKSLIRPTHGDDEEPRLRMLETIREYATDRLKANPDLYGATCRAHAAYFAELAQRNWRRLIGAEREAAVAEMAADAENLKLAWKYWVVAGDLEQLHKMTDALWLLYDRQGWYQDTVELTSNLLDLLSATTASPEQARQEIMLQTSLARAIMTVKGFTPEVEDAFLRALALSEARGEIPQMFPVLRGLSSYYMYTSVFDKGAQIGERLLELAESTNDDHVRVHGCMVLGSNTGFLGKFEKGIEILERGIALFEREPQAIRPYQLGTNPGIVCYTTVAFFLSWTGYPERAVAYVDRAIQKARGLNHPFSIAYALFHSGIFHMRRGDMELASERANATLELTEKHGFQVWDSLATLLLGATEMVLGQPDEGQLQIERAFERYRGLRTPPVFYPDLIGIRAEAFLRVGRPDEGLRLLDELFEQTFAGSTLSQMPELHRLRGDMLAAVSPENLPEALDIYRGVLAFAESAGAKLMALHAATRLCKLEMQSGASNGGGRALAEIYESFTEGFETADLMEAKRILDLLQK